MVSRYKAKEQGWPVWSENKRMGKMEARKHGSEQWPREEPLLTKVAIQIGLMEPKYRLGQELKKEGADA